MESGRPKISNGVDGCLRRGGRYHRNSKMVAVAFLVAAQVAEVEDGQAGGLPRLGQDHRGNGLHKMQVWMRK